MRKTYRYRLYPSKAQMSRLGDTLESCRWVYNETLALRKTSWETNEESISLYTTNKELTQWKKDKQELKQVHSQVLQNVQVRVDLAYKAFFRRIKSGETPGYPRFKGKGRYDSFTYPQSGFEIIDDRTIKVSKIGEIKAKIHRAVIGNVKTATLRRYPTGKWYVCFSTECAGSKVVLVNPAYTSQMCSRCGTIVKKELKDRIHKCNCCNLEMDRDFNASINILRLGLQSLD